MTARVERYRLEPEDESLQEVTNKGTSYAPGPQPEPSAPYVPPDLLEYLKKKFPNTPPAPTTAEQTLSDVSRIWGQQDVIRHLGSAINNRTEK